MAPLCASLTVGQRRLERHFATAVGLSPKRVIRITAFNHVHHPPQLRIHAQHTDIQVRRRCLNLIDQLVVLRARNIESELDAVER